MHTHKVLKNWDFHQDSIHCLHVNDSFSKVLTGSRSGEIFLTDLSKNFFCRIDKLNEPITALSMSSSLDIYAATSNNKLMEYRFKSSSPKNVFQKTSSSPEKKKQNHKPLNPNKVLLKQ